LIFIDTSLLVAFVVAKDTNHEKSVSIMEEIVGGKHGQAITSEYVFDETVTVVLVRSKSLYLASKTGDLIKESMPVLEVGNNTFEASWNRFRNQKDTKFSFTDCTILEVVESNHIDKLATFDREFEYSTSFKVVG
jgi:predicted nucleic acid-binding protein